LIRMWDECSVPVYDAIVINILDPPPLSFYANPLGGCHPLEVQFNEISADEGQTYLWNFGDNGESNLSMQKNPSHTYETYGVFDVSLQVTSQEGCVSSHTEYAYINVYRTPVAIFYAYDSLATRVYPVVTLLNESDMLDMAYWDFGDNEHSTEVHPAPHWYPQEPYTYTIMLVVTNPAYQSCRDTAYRDVTIRENITFYAPTAFVPEGTNPGNKVFNVFGHGIEKNRFHLIIFNRWGEKIFESFNYEHGWDGRTKNGTLVQNGVYSWIVTYYDIRGNQHQESGAVTVIR
ncbi:MAG: gliding motility-associated C-terminal domain-containing protein, partial [Bacteroidetes bacterium]|nr:gliding motility-associated C-terminal domain-containing protein [Bacteroidota bacterium]